MVYCWFKKSNNKYSTSLVELTFSVRVDIKFCIFMNIDQYLIPGINVFDVDINLLNKMFPYNFKSNKFDTVHTCCSKLNSGFCNLNYICFDRAKIFTLDLWLFEMIECLLFRKSEPPKFPTGHFEHQKLTDCMCILLYLIDLNLTQQTINVNFKEKFLKKYQFLFNDLQLFLIIKILEQINPNKELAIEHFLPQTVDVELVNFFVEYSTQTKNADGYSLFSRIKYRHCPDESKCSNVYATIFVPIQNANLDLHKGLHKYSTRFFWTRMIK